MAGDTCWLIIVLLCGLCVLARWARRHHASQVDRSSARAIHQRLLKPRTPDDCPACRRPSVRLGSAPPPAVRPWSELQSRRGAPQRIATDGFAGPNRACAYSGITNPQIRAVVGAGTHGKHERIQTFRCQACRTTFTSRRDTPLYRLKTASRRVAEVLSTLAEGLTLTAATRVFGHSANTITTWVTRAGRVPFGCSATLHDRWLRHLTLPHLPRDELRTHLRQRAQILWLWVALEPVTKLIPVWHLDARRSVQRIGSSMTSISAWLRTACRSSRAMGSTCTSTR